MIEEMSFKCLYVLETYLEKPSQKSMGEHFLQTWLTIFSR